jgi:large subunit ribosomal protein L6
MSRIGNKPVALPEKVNIKIDGKRVQVEGPKGKLEMTLPERIEASVDEGQVTFKRPSDNRQDKAFHGLCRSLVNNMVIGTSEGFQKKLEVHGVGFRAAVQGSKLNLNLGYSHPINYEIPEGIKITVQDQTKITIEGIDKQKVGAVAADIRRYYPPEPYKGKGVRYVGEIIRRKEGKTAQGK